MFGGRLGQMTFDLKEGDQVVSEDGEAVCREQVDVGGTPAL